MHLVTTSKCNWITTINAQVYFFTTYRANGNHLLLTKSNLNKLTKKSLQKQKTCVTTPKKWTKRKLQKICENTNYCRSH